MPTSPALALLFLAPTALASQVPSPCTSPTDSVRATAYVIVAPKSRTTLVPRSLLQSVLAAVVHSIPRPTSTGQVNVLPGLVVVALNSQLESPPLNRAIYPPRGPRLDLNAVVQLTIRHPGLLTDVRESKDDETPYGNSLRDAIAHLARDSIFIPLPADFVAEEAALELRVQLEPDTSAASQAVFALAEPEVATRGAKTQRHEPMPRFPSVGRERGGWADMAADFVIGTNGLPEMNTVDIRTVDAPDTDPAYEVSFAASVRDAIHQMHFDPARVGSCTVEQRVSLPVSFRSSR
jgi:hypothetical protein